MSSLVATASVTSTSAAVSVPSLMLQLLIGLGVVLALIWVASKVAKGRLAKPARTRGSATTLSVVSRQTLGKGVHVAVVRVGSETLLLGVTAHQVTRLADIPYEAADGFADEPGSELAGSRNSTASIAGKPVVAPLLQGVFRHLQELTIRRA